MKKKVFRELYKEENAQNTENIVQNTEPEVTIEKPVQKKPRKKKADK